jgi:tetratricopeptide (TPR) repeat protein
VLVVAVPSARRLVVAVALVAAVLLAAVAAGLFVLRRVGRAHAGGEPVLAVGQIADRRGGADSGLGGALTEMLATNLARAPDVRVISSARMYEVLARLGPGDTGQGAALAAARRAGATELVDGTLYTVPGGLLRLDLRRIALANGEVRQAFRVEGSDPYALADSGTAGILAELGAPALEGSVADVTTHSLAAFRLYQQGLRQFFNGDLAAATPLFRASLVEDSAFAKAAYYAALSAEVDAVTRTALMENAVRLAARASERERLEILAGSAVVTSDPALDAVADTLVWRYPHEPGSHLAAGLAGLQRGDFAVAARHFEEAIRLDTIPAGRRGRGPCSPCDALKGLIDAFVALDSFAAAERAGRRWVALEPSVPAARVVLAEVVSRTGRYDDALRVLREGTAIYGAQAMTTVEEARVLVHAGETERALATVRGMGERGSLAERLDAYWIMVFAERDAGRLDGALAAALHFRAEHPERAEGAAAPPSAMLQAQILLERGSPRAAVALFDSIVRWTPATWPASAAARHRAWNLTHVASAVAAAGDTIRLRRLADSIQAAGEVSGFSRDRRLHHYVRGLIEMARGHDEGAIAAFRASILSWTEGHTRAHAELARVLLRSGRAHEAVEVLDLALRNAFDGSASYVSRRTLRALRDSARARLGPATVR